MSNPYLSLYVHLIWGTYERQSLITADIEDQLYRCIHTECDKLRTNLLAIGGIENHVHLLISLPATLSVSTLVKQLKGSSSHFVTHELNRPNFKWQGGYGAFSISRSAIPRVKEYIHHQKEHHRNNTLLDSLERDEEPPQINPSPLPQSPQETSQY